MLLSAEAFNYAALPAEQAASARAAAERIRGRLNAAFIETGRDLSVQKDALGHGHFLKWIEAEFGLGERSAQRLISIAEMIDSNPSHGSDLENLSQRALRELAAPSTPAEVRTEVLERAAKGEKVTAKEIEALKKKLLRTENDLEKAKTDVGLTEFRARESEAQRDGANTARLFAEQAKDRLAQEVEDLVDEISRLKEVGVIHMTVTPPVHQVAHTAPPAIDPLFIALQAMWERSERGTREQFLDWITAPKEMAA